MVHTFRCLERYFALDVESGSVFEIDGITKKIIDEISPEDSLGDFSRVLTKEESEAKSEIDSLIRDGVLFSAEQQHKKPSYNGVIKAMCLNISHKCNMSCQYCFAHGGSYNDVAENMSIEVAKAAIDFLVAKSDKRHNLEVDFFGGEPILNLDVVKATVAYARSLELKYGKQFKFTVTTNALSLNDDAIDFFNKEMYNVVVSIDGRKSVHNTVRKTVGGKDSYDIVLRNALNFRSKRGDKQYYIRGTYTSLNKDFASDVLELNDLGFDQISVEPVVLSDGHKLALKKEDIPYLCDQYELLAEEYLKRRRTEKWFNFFHFMLDLENGPCESKRLVGCGAGNEYVAVSPDGSIYPCHQFDGNSHFRIGNVLTGEFDTQIPTQFALSNLTTKKDCNECWAKYYCSGGCAANAINFNGNIDVPYKGACDLMRKRVECSIAVNAIEREK